MDKEKWVDLLPSVIKKYNNTKHSTIGMTPNEARRGHNNVEVWLHIYKDAKFNRRYPPLSVGDQVRTCIEPTTFKKGYEPRWSREVYSITFIKDRQYLISDGNRKRVWNRHELLKISGAEGKDGGEKK